MAEPSEDRRIAKAVARAADATVSTLGLRIDRVVLRVLDRLRRLVETNAPDGVTVVLTLGGLFQGPFT